MCEFEAAGSVHSSDFTEKGSENPEIEHMIWKKNIQIPLNDDLKIKIVDFGNACYIDEHFSSTVSTCEYRCPETIIGYPYDEKCDIWSLGCMIYELITGDFLFEP